MRPFLRRGFLIVSKEFAALKPYSCSSQATVKTDTLIGSASVKNEMLKTEFSESDCPNLKDQEFRFDNTKVMFQNRKTSELFRAFFVLKLSSYQFIVKNSAKLIKLGQTILGEKLFKKLMQATFFGHFLAGESHEEILPIVNKLGKSGIKVILPHDLEELEEEAKTHSTGPNQAFCDEYFKFLEKSFQISNSMAKPTYIAIKLTTLGTLTTLQELSRLLVQEPGLRSIHDAIRLNQNKSISEEIEFFLSSLERIEKLLRSSASGNVRVLFDAEQTYFQPAINRVVMDFMRIFNTQEPIVYNTYQNYLKAAREHLLAHYNEAKQEGFCFGAKLVRGAYMDHERELARRQGYDDPINETYEKTSDMFHQNLLFLASEMEKNGQDSRKLAIMIGTHNEETARLAAQYLKAKRLNKNLFGFAQLYSMSDHISYSLGLAGYPVYKWLAFGPMDRVLPYLIRRAAENFTVIEKTKYERALVRAELMRRMNPFA